MRKIIFSILVLGVYTDINAQMRFGISDQLNPNAVVQIDTAEGTRKGLLLPRVQLRASNDYFPLGEHVAGMVVYNIKQAGIEPYTVYTGYYYNDGTKWNRVLSEQEISKVWLNSIDDTKAMNDTQKIYRTGYMGLGVTNPEEALDVNGKIKISGGTNTGKILINPGTSNTSSEVAYYNASNTKIGGIASDNNHLNYSTKDSLSHHVFQGGNIGIGTNTVPVKLVINGALKVGNEFNTTNAPEAGMIRFNNSSGKFQGYNGTDWLDLH